MPRPSRPVRPPRGPSVLFRRLPWVVLALVLVSPLLATLAATVALPPTAPPDRHSLRNASADTIPGPSLLFGTPAPGSDGPRPLRMITAPDDNLLEQSREFGDLPRIAIDGRKPWQEYARPDDPLARTGPRVALVITGLGLLAEHTAEAIGRTPPEVSLAFSSAAEPQMLNQWLGKARQGGHEVLLEVPVQTGVYPRQDPGPQLIQIGLSSQQNTRSLLHHLGRTQGYVGLLPTLPVDPRQTNGGLSDPSVSQTLLTEARLRGLMVLVPPAAAGLDKGVDPSARVHPLTPVARAVGVAHAEATAVLDAPDPDPRRLEANLAALADRARRDGAAVGLIRAYPVSIEAVRTFAARLEEQGVRLVPLTTLTVPDR